MKKDMIMNVKVKMFLAGLLVGIALIIIPVLLIVQNKIFIVNESKYDFEQTIATISLRVKEANWSISHIYDMGSTMKKNGYDINELKVLSLCNPKHASEILESENDRMVSAMMPCRVAVFQKDGKAYVAMLNLGLLTPFLGENVKETFKLVNKEIIEIISPLIE